MKQSRTAVCGVKAAFILSLVIGLGMPTTSNAQVQTFNDVPTSYWAFSFIRTFSANGITAGCGGGNYCPESSVTRAQMAVFLERGMNGGSYSPPAATGTVFNDVGANDFAASFIEQLSADGITAGCGGGNYCPDALVTRAQMAVFLLRAKYGSGYSPAAATGVFADVPPGSFAAEWIEALAAEGITAGCGNGNYCPDEPVTRAQMAVFMVRTFSLVFSNGAPTADDAFYTTSDKSFINAGLSGSDPEDDPITFTVVTPPSKGTFTSFDAATGGFTYEPLPGQDGVDSFTITATDPYQVSNEATVTIEIFAWSGPLQFGTAVDDFPTTSGLHFDLNGRLIVGGGTDGQIGSIPSAGGRDGWIRQLDRRGNEIWTVQAGNANMNNARIVARVPATNNVMMVLTDDDAETASVVKYDANGNKIFDVPVDFGDQSDLIVAVYWANVDDNGDIYILSWITPDSSVMTKVNGLSGATDWQVVFEGTNDNAVTPFDSEWTGIRLRSVDFDANGNLIVAGQYTHDNFDPPRDCSACSFIASFDPDGNQLWVREIDAFARDCPQLTDSRVYRVMVAPDGSLWATGSETAASASHFSFGQTSKFSADASQLIWTDCNIVSTADTSVFSFTPTRFANNGDGLVLSSDTVAGDPVTNPDGSSELIISRLSPDGEVRFRRTIALTRADDTLANVDAGDIVEDGQGLLYISGWTDGEFLPGGALGDDDVFIIRLDADGVPLD